MVMNKRIKELFKTIRKHKHTHNLMSNPPQVKYSYTIEEEDIEKFAELIIKEYADNDYVLCISRPLTNDQLADMYKRTTGLSARTGPIHAVVEWAKTQPWCYVDYIDGTIHKKGYAKPL
jgi:hypothetical protein